MKLGGNGSSNSLISVRNLDKTYERGGEVIHVLQGLVGCIVVLPVNGLTTGTMNWQTFSHLSFAFRITPALLALGIAFALVMGVLGGVPPAVRAARLPVAAALRDL